MARRARRIVKRSKAHQRRLASASWRMPHHTTGAACPTQPCAEPPIPRLDLCGGLHYRHYRISRHAQLRYQERIGQPMERLLADLDGATLFDHRHHPLHRKMVKLEQEGGYALRRSPALFLIKASDHGHHVVTIYHDSETAKCGPSQ